MYRPEVQAPISTTFFPAKSFADLYSVECISCPPKSSCEATIQFKRGHIICTSPVRTCPAKVVRLNVKP